MKHPAQGGQQDFVVLMERKKNRLEGWYQGVVQDWAGRMVPGRSTGLGWKDGTRA